MDCDGFVLIFQSLFALGHILYEINFNLLVRHTGLNFHLLQCLSPAVGIWFVLKTGIEIWIWIIILSGLSEQVV